jgi:UDP-N-acetylglucosamine 2-epimerase (non-hydrolysing)
MSKSFFEQLGIPSPDVNLECSSGTQAEQTANIMVRFERYLIDNPCDLVLVVGDVTSTMACSIVAKKLNIKVAHVEGGIRSGDWTMPEEINRIVTDSITDYFFTTSTTANENLRKQGVLEEQVFFVGNTMIDTLINNLDKLQKPALWEKHNLIPEQYFVLTLHRPANVDEIQQLTIMLREIIRHSRSLPIIFPVHPRTAKTLEQASIDAPNLLITAPLSYLEFIYLVKHAKAVITDSGGITEETTVLGVPCMTLRDNTERPETIELGTNELLGTDPKAIEPAMRTLFEGRWKKGSIPALWDGKTAERIVSHLLFLSKNKPALV